MCYMHVTSYARINTLFFICVLYYVGQNFNDRERKMLVTILLVILILALLGAIPVWPHSRSWGYWPGGVLGLVLLILIILLLLGRI